MSKEINGLAEKALRFEGELPKRFPRPNRTDRWPKEAEAILDRDYGKVHPRKIRKALAPILGREVTNNMLFGKANRMGLSVREPVWGLNYQKNSGDELPVRHEDEGESV
jgi:hypothetical protein